jgi:hypothetical protein
MSVDNGILNGVVLWRTEMSTYLSLRTTYWELALVALSAKTGKIGREIRRGPF